MFAQRYFVSAYCTHTRAHWSGTRRTYAAPTLLLSSSNKQTHTLKREQREQYTDTHTWMETMNESVKRATAAHGQCKIDVSSCLLLLWLCRLCRLCRSIPVCDGAWTLLFTHENIVRAFACADSMKPINSNHFVETIFSVSTVAWTYLLRWTVCPQHRSHSITLLAMMQSRGLGFPERTLF